MPALTDLVLRAMADPTRRSILRHVRDHELSAGAIAAQFPGISRPAVSQHLRVLTETELVTVRPVGNCRFYRLCPEAPPDVVAFLDEMWSDKLASLKAAAERRAQP